MRKSVKAVLPVTNPSTPAAEGPEEPDLKAPSLYLNRELSLLAFQNRVLEEAEDKRNPLLERVKFLSILGSNLDEFFMVRVAGVAAQIEAGATEAGADGLGPRAQLVAVRREVKKLLAEAHRCMETLMVELVEQSIFIHDYQALSDAHRRRAVQYFDETVFPVLTPLAFDPGRPFPHISNLSLNLAVLIRDKAGHEHFARVKVPDSLPPLVAVSRNTKAVSKRARNRRIDMVWLEEVIAANLGQLFPGMEVVESYAFHVTRDAEVAIKELEAEDLLETVEEGVRQRRFQQVVRLSVTREMPNSMLTILMNNLEVTQSEVYRTERPLSLKRLMHLYSLDRPDLKYPPFVPAIPKDLAELTDEEDMFAVIRRRDIYMHHPFDSFQPVIEFLRKAARDPAVLAIKICLYRVGRNSPVVEALLEAVEEDKQVAALVELKARFDEESNIEWARALERSGVHVVYGLIGLKIHSKVALVVRREQDRIARYVHISTGNYNAVTAHTYTDMGIFTCNEDIADDVSDLFNYLTGYSYKADYQKLLVAPVNLRARMEALIEREIKHAKAGNKGHLIFKMNSLSDAKLIRMLYKASRAGVRIQLLVRGICCLRPGVRGISDNIEVISIVGRFLEHSRVYYFRNNGAEEVYIGSADLMSRNIDNRVEVLVPVKDPEIIRTICDVVLPVYLADNVKARQMTSTGGYPKRKTNSRTPVNSQEVLLQRRANPPKKVKHVRSRTKS
ncbi:MAG TPA: polyphosphate kinase 1 [Candidatus Sulfopaludibacter sp.]|jgi:polyphosphate kinase|nr:polyphosphate kinase 1 [Candidatus Sulfopaludibacter sp.]